MSCLKREALDQVVDQVVETRTADDITCLIHFGNDLESCWSSSSDDPWPYTFIGNKDNTKTAVKDTNETFSRENAA